MFLWYVPMVSSKALPQSCPLFFMVQQVTCANKELISMSAAQSVSSFITSLHFTVFTPLIWSLGLHCQQCIGSCFGAGSSVLPPPPPPFLSIVKEEVTDDTAILPLYSGRIVSWVSRGLTPHPPLHIPPLTPPFISPLPHYLLSLIPYPSLFLPSSLFTHSWSVEIVLGQTKQATDCEWRGVAVMLEWAWQ